MDGKSEYIPTRRSLLNRLRDWNNQESWKEFFDTYWRLIYRTAMRAGLSEQEAQEVVQETVIAVAKNMPEFRYNPARGSFKGWLLHMTRWRITDQYRKRRPQETGWPNEEDAWAGQSVEQIPDPQGVSLEPYWEAQWQTNIAEVAIDRVKQSVSPKQFQAFDLYVMKECSAATVAKQLNLSIAQVYLSKHRITRLIRQEVAKVKQEVH